MRFDSEGLFWTDLMTIGRSKTQQSERPMPEIPETGWRAPTEYPNLSGAKVIGLDTETADPELRSSGPGWGRGRGNIVGVSLAVQDGTSWYFPIRHETCPEQNLDPETTLRWLSHVLGTNIPKVGANLIYDLGWLQYEGVTVGGELFDVQFAEALLNSEAPRVALEDLAQQYLGMGKETSLLYQWLSDWKGGTANERQRKWISLAPPSLVGPYAESDAALPLRIMEKQWDALHRRGVLDLFNLECKLIRPLVAMRMQGAPIDVQRAEAYHAKLGEEMQDIENQITAACGYAVNPNSGEDIAKACRALGIQYNQTESGKPSFVQSWLDNHEHPLMGLIVDWRRKAKIQGTFIESYILKNHVNGRIYCTFHPLKGDENGARSGRFSSSDPNLQNIPVRTAEGKLIRDFFTATKYRWRKWDYSQIEYRLLVHHAVGQGAEEARAMFNNDPDTDYHDFTIDLIRGMTGIELDRRPAKTINFGLIYGMSRGELIKRLGLGPQKGKELYESYHRAIPYAKATMDEAAREAEIFGTVTTLLGRKSDFNMWVPKKYDPESKPLSYDAALREYGSIERAFKHKALNRKLQGGAADVMKKAMVDLYEAGIFDRTGYPLLTVHDELDFDDPCEDPEDPVWAELKYIMENAVQTAIPIRVDGSKGPTWAKAD